GPEGPGRWTAQGTPPDAHLRENGGGDPRVVGESRERQGRDDLELSSPAGNVDQVAPEAVERPPRVRARTLRTQQRTESQRQLIYVLLPTSRGQDIIWCITRLNATPSGVLLC